MAAGAFAGVAPEQPDTDPRPPPGRRERIGLMIGALAGIGLGLIVGLLTGRGGSPEAVRSAIAVGLIAGLGCGGFTGAVVGRLTTPRR